MTTARGLFVAWYDSDPSFQPELDQWHSREHMSERVALPGFRTGQRYNSLDRQWRYCVLYRADEVRTFISAPYLQVLNNPTEWTRRMMPGIRNLNRSLCTIIRDAGAGFGSILCTIQFAPPSAGSEFVGWVDETAIPAVLAEPGAVRLTLAVADKAISQTRTEEQALRTQPDMVSDWILLVESYAASAIDSVWHLLSGSIEAHGGGRPARETFQLSHLLASP